VPVAPNGLKPFVVIRAQDQALRQGRRKAPGSEVDPLLCHQPTPSSEEQHGRAGALLNPPQDLRDLTNVSGGAPAQLQSKKARAPRGPPPCRSPGASRLAASYGLAGLPLSTRSRVGLGPARFELQRRGEVLAVSRGVPSRVPRRMPTSAKGGNAGERRTEGASQQAGAPPAAGSARCRLGPLPASRQHQTRLFFSPSLYEE
jgi:hypothetical protein